MMQKTKIYVYTFINYFLINESCNEVILFILSHFIFYTKVVSWNNGFVALKIFLIFFFVDFDLI